MRFSIIRQWTYGYTDSEVTLVMHHWRQPTIVDAALETISIAEFLYLFNGPRLRHSLNYMHYDPVYSKTFPTF